MVHIFFCMFCCSNPHRKFGKLCLYSRDDVRREIFCGGGADCRSLVPQISFRVDGKSAGKSDSGQKGRPEAGLKRSFRSRRRTQRANYYTNRKVLSLPIIKFPNLDVNFHSNLEANLKIAVAHLQLTEKGKVSTKQEETLNIRHRLKQKTGSGAELERLTRGAMEGKSGNGSSGQGKFSKNDDHQSAAVNVRERKFPDDKKRVCSSAECKTFLGEANRNRKSKDSHHVENADPVKPGTTEKYLQDSYNNAFQKHVDNLTNVISQHRNSTGVEKPKTEVHIHPTENSRNVRNTTPQPLSQLEIKSEAGVNQKITFAQEAEDEEELEDFAKMDPVKKKVNVLTEDLEEDLFEEIIEPKPMITFNHVCSEAESDQISFNQIKTGSRSPSPMLEVPNSKSCQKMASRPPL